MKSFLVMFDAPPSVDPTGWMKQAAQKAELFFADLDQVATKMSQDPKAQKALLASKKRNEDPALAPHYAKALEAVAGKQKRVAVNSVSWLVFGQKPAVAIVDFDGLEGERAKGKKAGLTDAQYDQLVANARKTVEDRLAEHLSADRVLVLPKGASDAEKAKAAVAFIKKCEAA